VTIATWEGMLARLNRPQPIEVNGKTYDMQLRFRRYYRPYRVELIDFSHDKYTGTERARNFASRVRLLDPNRGVDREVTIRMNEPLRYAGETFYQQSFIPGNDRMTVLQIVRNPGWVMPYVACAIGALGMLIHFGMHLVTFLRKRAQVEGPLALRRLAAPAAAVTLRDPEGRRAAVRGPSTESGYQLQPRRRWTGAAFAVPAVAVAVCLVYLMGHAAQGPYAGKDGVNVDKLARVPVSFDGRPMPLDAVARGNLKIISGRESIKTDDGRVPAIQWLTDVLADNDRAHTYKVFRVDNLELKGLLDLDPKEKLFSWQQLVVDNGNGEKLMKQVRQAGETPDKSRDLYQRKVIELYQHFTRFMRFVGASDVAELYDVLRSPQAASELEAQVQAIAALDPKELNAEQQRTLMRYDRLGRQVKRVSEFLATEEGRKDDLFFGAPPQAGEEFQGLGLAVKAMREGQPVPESARQWLSMLGALRHGQASQFNAELAAYQRDVATRLPDLQAKSGFEVFFHRFDPFTLSMVFYVMALVLAAGSWLGWSRPLGRAALAVLCLTLLVHTGGLLSRMYISGRPPVTNLYSSAVFIGWGGIVLCLLLEAIFRNGVGSVTAAVLGFGTLLIADRLDVRDADTMAQLEAVLDTNFWLATHVVVITLGYAATFLAGLLAIVYVFRGVFTPDFRGDERKDVARMVYGVLCFATLASFVGTILGGIWADQSWGRFWGWDPKENGAVLIVLWNALILHARWGGVVRERGVMLLAVGGNLVTAWSWFGTNMLGVGLHSYGFMEGAVPALLGFWVSQLALIAIGMLPLRMWRSHAADAARASAAGSGEGRAGNGAGAGKSSFDVKGAKPKPA
jgi:ABC-type transport system involved in cytochrome c biogenesis permease subunit